MANKIDIGDVVRFAVTFKNLAGTAVDPTTVKVQVKLPDNTEVEYIYLIGAEVVKNSVGVYQTDFLITQGGIHYYKWTGTGAVYAAEESQFFVKITQF